MENCLDGAVDLGIVKALTAPTEEQMTLSNRAFTEITQPCLIEHGYPTVPPPSLQISIDSGRSWHPYDAIFYANLYALPEVAATDPDVRSKLEQRDELWRTCPADLNILIPQLEANAGQG